MSASTIRVTGKSFRAGRKFLTPEIRLSRPTPPMPPSRSRSVSCVVGSSSKSVECAFCLHRDDVTHPVRQRAEPSHQITASGGRRRLSRSRTKTRHAHDVSQPGQRKTSQHGSDVPPPAIRKERPQKKRTSLQTPKAPCPPPPLSTPARTRPSHPATSPSRTRSRASKSSNTASTAACPPGSPWSCP